MEKSTKPVDMAELCPELSGQTNQEIHLCPEELEALEMDAIDMSELSPEDLIKVSAEAKEMSVDELVKCVSEQLVFKMKYDEEVVIRLRALEKACVLEGRSFEEELRRIPGAKSIRAWQNWKAKFEGRKVYRPNSRHVDKQVLPAAVSAFENEDGSVDVQWRDSGSEMVWDIHVPAESIQVSPKLPDWIPGSFGSICTGIDMPGLAAKEVGLKVLWGVDSEPNCVETVQKNFPDVKMYGKKVGALTDEEIRDMARAFMVWMSTPCQQFSGANRTTARWDGELNRIAFDCLKVIQRMQPAIVVLENVEMMVSGDSKDPVVLPILAAWESLGYTFAAWDPEKHILGGFILHGTDAGCCQTRPRTIIVAYKRDVFPGLIPSMPLPISETEVPKIRDVIPEAISVITDKGQPQSADEYLGTVTRSGMTVVTAEGEERKSIDDLRKVFGIPDWYQLVGTDAQKQDRLGNCVIPAFAEWLIRHIVKETAMILPETNQAA